MSDVYKLPKGFTIGMVFDVNYDYHLILRDKFNNPRFIVNIGNEVKDPASYDLKLFGELANLVIYLKEVAMITILVSTLLDGIQLLSKSPTRLVLKLPKVV